MAHISHRLSVNYLLSNILGYNYQKNDRTDIIEGKIWPGLKNQAEIIVTSILSRKNTLPNH